MEFDLVSLGLVILSSVVVVSLVRFVEYQVYRLRRSMRKTGRHEDQEAR